jgi:hypothetical protein
MCTRDSGGSKGTKCYSSAQRTSMGRRRNWLPQGQNSMSATIATNNTFFSEPAGRSSHYRLTFLAAHRRDRIAI